MQLCEVKLQNVKVDFDLHLHHVLMQIVTTMTNWILKYQVSDSPYSINPALSCYRQSD